ncbi:MAG: hypothetical protein WKF84_31010 [Pyrinomonadaceae bacterium]
MLLTVNMGSRLSEGVWPNSSSAADKKKQGKYQFHLFHRANI